MLNTPLSFCHEIIPRLWLGSLRSFTDELLALVKWEEKLHGETTCEFDVRLYAMFRYILAGVSNKEMRILYGQMSLKIMDEYERDDAFIVTMRADCMRAVYERPFQTY